MENILIKKFVKNYKNTNDAFVRKSYQIFASVIGIICNVILCVLKIIIGTLSDSIAIVSDGINNLSDCASCIVTIVGSRFAAKPADKEHPYGHGREEYLTSMLVAVIIIAVGVQLFKSSVERIIQPENVKLSIAVAVITAASIIVKFWISGFYKKIGSKINSTVMEATGKDAFNDVISTAVSFIGALLAYFGLKWADGVMGIAVSIFILKGGLDIILESANDLIGTKTDPETVKQLEQIVLENKRILAVHDTLIHSYGPSTTMASCHAEVNCNENLKSIHAVVDSAERKVYRKLGISLTIHIDPVDIDCGQEKNLEKFIMKRLISLNDNISIHDLQIMQIDGKDVASFDILVPYDIKYSDEKILKLVSKWITEFDKNMLSAIRIDKG